jgi:hypothetical protein
MENVATQGRAVQQGGRLEVRGWGNAYVLQKNSLYVPPDEFLRDLDGRGGEMR